MTERIVINEAPDRPADSLFDSSLPEIRRLRHGDRDHWGPLIQLWDKNSFFTPDECYEALVSSQITPSTVWLDVGCGRNLFPANEALSQQLADRCLHLTGLDPDETIEENPFLHAKCRAALESFETEQKFDLITLRMVVEHIERPDECVRKLSSLLSEHGRIVVYTVSKYAPSSIISALTPHGFHNFVKSRIWRAEAKDTFPVHYKMNTRRELKYVFQNNGLEEVSFFRLDEPCLFWKHRIASRFELAFWKATTALKVKYPESSILCMYAHRKLRETRIPEELKP